MVGLMNVSNQGFVVPLTITITMSVMMETFGVWRLETPSTTTPLWSRYLASLPAVTNNLANGYLNGDRGRVSSSHRTGLFMILGHFCNGWVLMSVAMSPCHHLAMNHGGGLSTEFSASVEHRTGFRELWTVSVQSLEPGRDSKVTFTPHCSETRYNIYTYLWIYL